jgi:hypothetical protein
MVGKYWVISYFSKERSKNMKRTLSTTMKSASYCCEASETMSASDLPKAEGLKRELDKDMKSASYCCEASETVSASELPTA